MNHFNRSFEQDGRNAEDTLPVSPSSVRVPRSPNRQVRHEGYAEPTPRRSRSRGSRGSSCTAAVNSERRGRADIGVFSKFEACRLHALEALSRFLFEDDRGRARHTTPRQNELGGAGERRSCSHFLEVRGGKPTSSQPPVLERLRRRAATLVGEEREKLRRECHVELQAERALFEARKHATFEEACRRAWKEQALTLQRQEHELRMVLARREFEDIKDAVRERILMGYAQEKEKTLARLRRSLGRGAEHSVNGLREELWNEAQKKRTRALDEGEAAFDHSCRLLRQQSNLNTQTKMDRMTEEAATAEKSALMVLREVEEKATAQGLWRVNADLKKDWEDAEAELERHLHTEAAEAVNIAVKGCTTKHELAQHEATAKAAARLQQAVDSTCEDEVARTKAVLGREARFLDERSSSFLPVIEEELSTCSLWRMAEAEAPRMQLSSPLPPFHAEQKSERAHMKDGGDGGRFLLRQDSSRPDDGGGTDDERRSGCLKSQPDEGKGDDTRDCSRATRAVALAERTAAVAERKYTNRARELVRLRAATSLRNRSGDGGTRSLTSIFAGGEGEHEKRSSRAKRNAAVIGERPLDGACPEKGETGGGFALACGGCAVLYEANERLLQEARARGFLR